MQKSLYVICVFPNGGTSFYRGEVASMIIDELIPTINRDYRTIARPGSYAVAGFSMGGFGAVILSVMNPGLFCVVGSLGGVLWEAEEQLHQAVEKALPVWKEYNCVFFFANGDNDNPEAFSEFSTLLSERGIDNNRVILQDTGHRLGLYYEKSSGELLRFIGLRIKTR